MTPLPKGNWLYLVYNLSKKHVLIAGTTTVVSNSMPLSSLYLEQEEIKVMTLKTCPFEKIESLSKHRKPVTISPLFSLVLSSVVTFLRKLRLSNGLEAIVGCCTRLFVTKHRWTGFGPIFMGTGEKHKMLNYLSLSHISCCIIHAKRQELMF